MDSNLVLLIAGVLLLWSIWLYREGTRSKVQLFTPLLLLLVWDLPAAQPVADPPATEAVVEQPAPIPVNNPFPARPGESSPVQVSPNIPEPVARWAHLADIASRECGVPLELLLSVMTSESYGDPNAQNESSWATGLIQVIPFESHILGPRFAYARDEPRPTIAQLKDPLFNLRWGACFLRDHYDAQDGGWYQALRRYYGIDDTDIEEDYARRILDRWELYQQWPQEVSSGGCCTTRPTAGGIIKGYGVPVSYQTDGLHTGIDYAGKYGDPIYAAGGGTVVHVGGMYCIQPGKCRGPHTVIIDHGDNVYSAYGHNSAARVRVGDVVSAGTHIADIGNEGYSFGPHLHFEVISGCTWSGDWTAPFVGTNCFDNPSDWF